MSLHLLQDRALAELCQARPGETRLGQVVKLASQFGDYQQASASGCRFALLGVPEQIGPMANCGKGGAHQGWQAFLRIFLNLQSNQYLAGEEVLLLGRLDCDDLQPAGTLEDLRHQCGLLDQRLVHVLKEIFAAGLTPILIGGGHNNAYGLIRACSEYLGQPLAVTNFDPHGDFRQMEGRHSGNPFRYACHEGYLSHYAILGLHEQKNSREALEALGECGFPWYSIQQLRWRRELSFEQAMEKVCAYLQASNRPIGLELDMDAISDMPTSAITSAGMSLDDAIHYVYRMAEQKQVQYLHLAEAAPERHPSGPDAGARVTGQALAELVCTFIRARR
ncbi:formimidoylglutamase [Bowmanella dokdonensis]|uniref:Formimidoylglutamase n=1 Tax=Bowmanella dokdonensis TaxID=751969 RepID=A0A939IP75_9ALTE|nr:formimidoylglutamase [Bowmanella dokdonensis]MBN7823679.1 formimidoylglutamase [Bowmanella dokdonensis]